MYDKEVFSSPELVDEQLDLSLRQLEPGTPDRSWAERDPNLLLISDLRSLYHTAGTEHARSLQRVWERLQQQPAHVEPVLPEAARERHLRLLKPAAEIRGSQERERGRMHGRGLAMPAAVLFLVLMVGSLLTIVHLTRLQANNAATPSRAASQPAGTPQPTSTPDYPYAPPGQTFAVSLPSSDGYAALSWAPDGHQLALCTQGKIWILDIASQTDRLRLDMPLAGSSIKALAWSPDGRYLAVGSNPIKIIDPASGSVLSYLSADYPILPITGQTTLVTALGWSPNGNLLAVATRHMDGTSFVFAWDRVRGTGLNTFTGQNSGAGISSLSWSSDNRYIASTDGRTVQAWDVYNPSVLIFNHPVDAPTAVAWSARPGWLAFVNQRETQVWDVWQGSDKQGQLVSSYPAASGLVSWSPDGNYLATAAGRTVILFDARSGAHIYTYTGAVHPISALAWSPDGASIAVGESGTPGPNYARVWSA